jgi:aspartate-semialdehyde dehydrogenase
MRPGNVAIVGGDTLLARELETVFSERAADIALIQTGFEQQERGSESGPVDEVEVVLAFDEAILAATAVVMLAGTPETSRRAFEFVARRRPRPALIDLTYALEEEPGARLRAPMAEPPEAAREAGEVFVVAHPAATVLAAFFRRLRGRYDVRRWVAHIFEPASERGKVGIDELQQQTVQLLSFRALPKRVFDEQISFNLLARYGSAAPHSLESIEARIERHLATLLARSGLIPMPSLRLIQAPVFHGHSFSLWIEFEEPPEIAELAATLASEGIEVRTADQEAPTNVAVAGQSGMIVGVIEKDRNDPRCAWFWIVADNHRTMAENAVRLAESLLASRRAE